ncbi:MAG: M20/M25/M40 family metallo-hydrolase [Anaerolineae bacterium]
MIVNTRDVDWAAVETEVVEMLRGLLRLDTTNPPGNEIIAAEYIADILRANGIEPTVLSSAAGRGNVVARLKGDGSAPPLLLMGHIDVVPAEPDKWRYPPFSGELVDGEIWGRGATDMKNVVAMELMVFLLVKRLGLPLKRDLIFMATADEEVGGSMGAGWLVDTHPELIRAEYAINEGGPTAIVFGDKTFFACSTAEKGTARFTLRARGAPGHASLPHNDNAILKLGAALQRLGATTLPMHVIPTVRAHVEAIAAHLEPQERANLLNVLSDDPAVQAEAIARLPLPDVGKRRLFAATHNTATPTILSAGSKINVIPAEAEALVDGRILPGQTGDGFMAELRAALGDDVELEFHEPVSPGLEADPSSPLFALIQEVVAAHEPGAVVVPALITGGTDAKSVVRLGTKVLGFVPMRYEGPALSGLAHNHNERVSVANLSFGTRIYFDVVSHWCGQ